MTRLTEGMVIGRTKASDLNNVRSLNCWGSELSDVSLVRQMANVEVLSLSVNKITTLEDFGYCPNLAELYVRKNMIHNLSDIIYLTDLPKLKNLWLEDNPCAVGETYRLTVLKYLPNLKKLDNILVEADEVQRASIYGETLSDPSEARHSITRDVSPPPKTKSDVLPPSPPRQIRSPENKNNGIDSEGNIFPNINNTTMTIAVSDSIIKKQVDSQTFVKDRRQSLRNVVDPIDVIPQNVNTDFSPTSDDGRPSNRMARKSISEMGSVTPTTPIEKRVAIASPLEGVALDVDHPPNYNNQTSNVHPVVHTPPHSTTTFYQASHAYQNAPPIRPNAYLEDNIAPQQPQQQQQHHQSQVDYNQYRYHQQPSQFNVTHQHPQISGIGSGVGGIHNPLHGQGHNVIHQRQIFEKITGDMSNKSYASAPTRPKNRNSNILSAVLCLIKELDCASLEVVEMAVRCRMDELD